VYELQLGTDENFNGCFDVNVGLAMGSVCCWIALTSLLRLTTFNDQTNEIIITPTIIM